MINANMVTLVAPAPNVFSPLRRENKLQNCRPICRSSCRICSAGCSCVRQARCARFLSCRQWRRLRLKERCLAGTGPGEKELVRVTHKRTHAQAGTSVQFKMRRRRRLQELGLALTAVHCNVLLSRRTRRPALSLSLSLTHTNHLPAHWLKAAKLPQRRGQQSLASTVLPPQAAAAAATAAATAIHTGSLQRRRQP